MGRWMGPLGDPRRQVPVSPCSRVISHPFLPAPFATSVADRSHLESPFPRLHHEPAVGQMPAAMRILVCGIATYDPLVRGRKAGRPHLSTPNIPDFIVAYFSDNLPSICPRSCLGTYRLAWGLIAVDLRAAMNFESIRRGGSMCLWPGRERAASWPPPGDCTLLARALGRAVCIQPIAGQGSATPIASRLCSYGGPSSAPK